MKKWIKVIYSVYKDKLGVSHLEKEYDYVINIYETCEEVKSLTDLVKTKQDETKKVPK